MNEKVCMELGRGRETARQTAREKQLHLQASILASVRESVVATDLVGRVLHWSSGAERLYGYRAEEVTGKAVPFVATPEEKAEEVTRISHAREHGSWAGVNRRRRRDGSRFWSDTVLSLVRDSDGEPIGFVSIDRDFTQRMHLASELDLANRCLQAALRHAQPQPLLRELVTIIRERSGCETVGIRLIDSDDTISSEAYDGFPRGFSDCQDPVSLHDDQCMGIGVFKSDVDTSRPFFTLGGSFFCNATSEQQASTGDDDAGTITSTSREYGYESVALVPMRLDEEILGLIHLADSRPGQIPIDLVTALEGVAMQLATAIRRMQREAALQRSYEELEHKVTEVVALHQAISDASPDGIVVVNADETISYASAGLARLLGYEGPSRIEGAVADSLLVPEDRERAQRNIELARRRGQLQAEYRLLHRDRREIPVEINAARIEEPHVDPPRLVGIIRDISERKRAEQELRDSEFRFRTVADFTYDWEYWIGADGSPFYISPSCERITGYDTEEFVNDTSLLERLIHHEDLPRVRGMLLEELQSQETRVVEFRVQHHDGSIRWIGHISQPVYGERGEFLGRRASNRDITEQKQAEALLRESEELHRKTLSSISDAVMVSDGHGNIVFASGNLWEIFGLDESQVHDIGNLRHLLGEEILDHARKAIEEHRNLEIRTTVGIGAKVLLVALHRVAIHGGSLLVTCRDISEQAHAQEEEERLQAMIRRAANEWQATFDALTQAVLVFDAGGVLRRLNASARSMLDRPYSELVGCRLTGLGDRVPWPEVAQAVAEVLHSRQPGVRPAHDSGTATSWEITTIGATLSDDFQAVICVVRDISEELRLQERLRRSETMSALGSLVAGVAHEVRNPLFAISATIDALEECHGDLEELRPFHGGLRTQVERLQTVMSELLELGRPIGDDLRLCNLDQIADEAIALVPNLAERHGVTIERRIDRPDLLVSVHLERIAVACRNLLANACAHSPVGATVELETLTTEDQVHLLVRDHGSGFQLGDLPLVFKPFFSRRRDGVGLGLAIVARTVELHGGGVTAYNHPGGGAVVEIRLPLDAANREV